MVSTFELESTKLQHLCHSSDLCLGLLDRLWVSKVLCSLVSIEHVNREGLFDVDPSLQVVRHTQIFDLRLSFERVCIKVATRHEDELALEDTLLTKPLVNLLESF